MNGFACSRWERLGAEPRPGVVSVGAVLSFAGWGLGQTWLVALWGESGGYGQDAEFLRV